MQTWLLQSLLVSVFAGNSDRAISQARAAIRESLLHDRNFPTEKLFDALGRNGRLARLDERGIEEVLGLEYKSSKCFFALSLLYDNLDWGGTQYHIDHIIPKSHAERRSLMGMNVPEHRIKEIIGSVNQLGNLQHEEALRERLSGQVVLYVGCTGHMALPALNRNFAEIALAH